MPSQTRRALIIAISYAGSAVAHDNGMDMSMDGAMSLASGQMLPYLHFTPGDQMWFVGWVPKSVGAMIGTCIGLFLLGVLERWMSACKSVIEVHWNKRAQIIQSNRRNALPTATPNLPYEKDAQRAPSERVSAVPPFIWVHDVTRGMLYASLALFQFTFMLAVMTFQFSFILSLAVGLGVGETLFGRYASIAAQVM